MLIEGGDMERSVLDQSPPLNDRIAQWPTNTHLSRDHPLLEADSRNPRADHRQWARASDGDVEGFLS